MGSYLTPGHTYVDGSTVTGPNLTEHVAEATFKPTAISDQTLRTPATLTDQVLVAAGGVLFQETLQQIHDLILYPGSVVKTVYAEYVANTNLSVAIPLDDTIPQNTEGVEILSVAIIPRFATSQILARFQGFGATIAGTELICALFRDAISNALAASSVFTEGASVGVRRPMHLEYLDSPATTSSITYKIRVGTNSGTAMRLNGSNTARLFGGAARATLVLQEIKV